MFTSNHISKRVRMALLAPVFAVGLLCRASGATAAIEITATEPVGVFDGLEYQQVSGWFSGATRSGEYRVPFTVFRPAAERRGNGVVLFEPPHFLYAGTALNFVLGREFLFRRGYSHAMVGFSENGQNLLGAKPGEAIIAGEPATSNDFPYARDIEIVSDFVDALRGGEIAPDGRRPKSVYAYGVSQTANALLELAYGPGAESLFDMILLHQVVLRVRGLSPDQAEADAAVMELLPDEFEPRANIGKVLIVGAEGDQVISDSRQLRNAVKGPLRNPDYRLYEVAASPHLFATEPGLNWLDNAPVVRAVFLAGHRWVQRDETPPASRLLTDSDEIDPVYGELTGIARDANGNALGGVRLPAVAAGSGRFVPSLPGVEYPPGAGITGLVGSYEDLACEETENGRPRYASTGTYVERIARQAINLTAQRLLTAVDAKRMVAEARQSGVGDEEYCGL